MARSATRSHHLDLPKSISYMFAKITFPAIGGANLSSPDMNVNPRKSFLYMPYTHKKEGGKVAI